MNSPELFLPEGVDEFDLVVGYHKKNPGLSLNENQDVFLNVKDVQLFSENLEADLNLDIFVKINPGFICT